MKPKVRRLSAQPNAVRGNRVALRMVVLDDGERKAPTEFRIWPMGKVDTSKGTFLFDEKAAASVMAEYRRQGNELSFDYEHQAVSDPPIRAPAAGWFKLDLRDDGLYAVSVRWTSSAEAHLNAGEYRYFSPAFETEEKTGRIVRLINIALTNVPATRNMTPLVAAKASQVVKGATDMKPKKTAAQKLTDEKMKAKKLAAEKASALAATSEAEVDAEETDGVDTTDATGAADAATAMADHAEGLADAIGDLADALGGDGDAGEADEGDDQAMADADDETGELSDTDDDETGELSDTDDAESTSAVATSAKAKALAAAKAKKLAADVITSVVKLTGTKDPAKQIAKLAALGVRKEEAPMVQKLSARIAELEQNEIDRKANALVNRAVKEMRLPPAKKALALSFAKKDPTLEILRHFLDALPAQTVSATATKQPKTSEISVATLSDDDRSLCMKLGVKPEDFVKTKAAANARRLVTG